ncbi:MAG: hypothetical protein ACR2OX_01405 [Methyloligellaceae bacterium]
MTDADAKEVRTPKLPVWRIVWDSYRILFGNFGTYVRLSWFPFLVLVANTTAMEFYYRASDNVSDDQPIAGTFFYPAIPIASIALWLVTIPIATAWTRLVFFGQDAKRARISYVLGKRELVYSWRYVSVAFMALAVPCILFGTIVVGAWLGAVDTAFDFPEEPSTPTILAVLLLVWMLGLFSVCRLLIALPGAAVGYPSRFRDSWRLTRGHGLRIFFVLFVAFVPENLGLTAIVLLAPSYEFSAGDGIAKALLIGIGENSFVWIFYTLSITSLALIYKQLVGPSHPEPNSTPAP